MDRIARTLALSALLLSAGCGGRERPEAPSPVDARMVAMQHRVTAMQFRLDKLEVRVGTLEGMVASLAMRPPAPAPAPESKKVREALVRVRCQKTERGYTLTGAEWAAIVRADPSDSMQAGVLPEVVEGKVVGMRLFAIAPDSLLASCGFEDDDLVETANGASLSSPGAMLQAWSKLAGETQVDVTIVRRGQSIRRVITRTAR